MLSNNTPFDDFNHIVKCKEINIEINDTIQKRNSSKDFRDFIIYLLIVFLFFINRIYDANPKLLVPSCIFFAIVVIIAILVLKEKIWNLKIKNKKIYIHTTWKHHLINYSDLLNFELRKVYKCNRYSTYHLIKPKKYASKLVDALVIRYVKNQKAITVILEIQEHLKEKVEEICKAFITANQYKINPVLYYNDYLDIGGEDIDTKLEIAEKHYNKMGKFILIILAISIIPLLIIIYRVLKLIL